MAAPKWSGRVPLRKTQAESKAEKEAKKPTIKKPLNAFMLYMKEMRAKVIAECTLKESAAINQILGRRVRPRAEGLAGRPGLPHPSAACPHRRPRLPPFPLQWHALSREEQAKYYELARKERQLHMQLYPGWSARDNYVSGQHRRDGRVGTCKMPWPRPVSAGQAGRTPLPQAQRRGSGAVEGPRLPWLAQQRAGKGSCPGGSRPGPVFHPGYTSTQGCCPVFDWATWAEGEEGAWDLPPPFKTETSMGKGGGAPNCDGYLAKIIIKKPQRQCCMSIVIEIKFK